MKRILPLLAILALCGCQSTAPTVVTFDFGGTNKFRMSSSKEVSASLMTLTNPNGVSITISNYVSKIANPSDALAATLDKAIEAYLKSKP